MKLLTSILAIFLFTSLSFSPEREEKFMDARKAKFKEFIDHFPKASLPFALSKEKLAYYSKNHKKVLTKDKLIDTKYQYFFTRRLQGANNFSRSFRYINTYYVAKLKETPSYTAIIYAVCNAEDASRINFYLATHDHTGKQINTLYIASVYDGVQPYQDIYITKDFKMYFNVYQPKIIDYGMYDYSYSYVINKDGDFEEHSPNYGWYKELLDYVTLPKL